MPPSSAWVSEPGIARMPTHASDVPTASLIGRRSHAVNAGTITMPPPIPSSPDSRPAATPIGASRTGRTAATAGLPALGPRRSSRERGAAGSIGWAARGVASSRGPR